MADDYNPMHCHSVCIPVIGDLPLTEYDRGIRDTDRIWLMAMDIGFRFVCLHLVSQDGRTKWKAVVGPCTTVFIVLLQSATAAAHL